MSKTKKLPRNDKGHLMRTFTANGNKYRILDPVSDGITIDRWTKFQQMTLVAGYGANFAQFTANLDKLTAMLNGVVRGVNQLTDLVFHVAEMKRGIVETTQKNYDADLYFCTLFIVRDGEDLTRYDEQLAEEKLSDWNAEGYDVQDFFLLSKAGIQGFQSAKEKAKEELNKAGISSESGA